MNTGEHGSGFCRCARWARGIGEEGERRMRNRAALSERSYRRGRSGQGALTTKHAKITKGERGGEGKGGQPRMNTDEHG